MIERGFDDVTNSYYYSVLNDKNESVLITRNYKIAEFYSTHIKSYNQNYRITLFKSDKGKLIPIDE